MPAEVKKARRLTACDFIDALNKYIGLPYEKVVELSNDTSLPARDHIMLSLVRYAAVGRSTKHVELLLDRLIGPTPRPKETPDPIDQAKDVNPYSHLPPDQLTEEIDLLTEKCKEEIIDV
jgi:hypothetical protein